MAIIAAFTVFLGIASNSFGLPASEVSWRDTASPHFRVLYKTAFMPSGLVLSLEKLHNRLRLDLSMFSPWMEKERISLYLYPDQQSYLDGDFHPPKWSSGLAFYQHRALAIPDPGDHQRLIRVIAHETTHLLFESYWAESGRMPPQWLNEGLALMEENKTTDEIGASEWAKALSTLPIDRLIPIAKFMQIVPTNDLADKGDVSIWYVEAFSVANFLYRGRSRLQFSLFCKALRDRQPVDQALWTVYRFRDTQAFEKAWKDWLRQTFRMPEHGALKTTPEKTQSKKSMKPAKQGFQPIDFPNFQFRGLMERNDSNQ